MAFIRAVESGSTVAISKSIERYPFLCTLVVNPYDPSLAAGRGLASARSHAVELAREHAVSELTRLHESQATMSEAEARSTRLRNTRLLSRLSPGKGKFIQATRDAHGNLHTHPEEMAVDFNQHWSKVFKAGHTDAELRRRWFDEDLPPSATASLPRPDSDRWTVQRKDVRKAIQCSGNSAPGPDGIPAEAYRQLGELAADVLYEAFLRLSAPDGEDLQRRHLPDFNHSLLHLIPKKESGFDDLVGPLLRCGPGSSDQCG